MRKVFTFALAVVMVMAMAVPAMAAAVGSPTAPVAEPDQTTPLPVVVDQENGSLIVPIEEADILSDAAMETFITAEEELMDEEKQKEIIPEGMTTLYFFYYVPAEPTENSALTLEIGDLGIDDLKIDDPNVDSLDIEDIISGRMVVKQFRNGEWIELKVVVNPDGTITILGLGAGPVAVFVKRAE